jgi:hypothetical protein
MPGHRRNAPGIVAIDYNVFPLLDCSNHRKTSDPLTHYNCIAWAAGKDNEYWWPDLDGVWPIVEREETVECFIKAFESLRYKEMKIMDNRYEHGIEKVAIFAGGQNFDEPTHAARQVSGGKWTSKMGLDGEDIEHELDDLVGPAYGRVVCILERGERSFLRKIIRFLSNLFLSRSMF